MSESSEKKVHHLCSVLIGIQLKEGVIALDNQKPKALHSSDSTLNWPRADRTGINRKSLTGSHNMWERMGENSLLSVLVN